MDEVKTKEKTIFSIYCPYLKRNIALKKDTWNYKIIAKHSEVAGILKVVEEILSKQDTNISIYRKKNNPSKIAIFKDCPQLLPYNNKIKIALQLKGVKDAVVTTIHGVNNIPLDMEEIK